MMNLFEIMQSAQGGNAVNNLARQFGISPEQAQGAVEAMLPAFSMGLQKQAETPDGFATLLGMLGGSGQAAEAFADANGDGIPDHLQQHGSHALGSLFGGGDMQQAVANQAAQFAGLNASLIQQMLPAITAMLMGGLFKGAASNGLGGLLQQFAQTMQGMPGAGMQPGGMMGGMGMGTGMGQNPMSNNPMSNNPMTNNPLASNPMGGLLGAVLVGMMGAQQKPQPQQMPGLPGNLGDMLGGLFGGAQPTPQPPQPSDPMAAGLDMLKGMFQSGQQAQSQQMDAFASIFEQFTKRR